VRRPPADIRQALGQAVKKLRTEHRLTQEELADKAGIHAHYVSDVERGIRNVAIVNLTYLAGAFDLSAAELLGVAGL
jgi:transcriptional regulator with XRE-family HTH domain